MRLYETSTRENTLIETVHTGVDIFAYMFTNFPYVLGQTEKIFRMFGLPRALKPSRFRCGDCRLCNLSVGPTHRLARGREA